MPDQNQPDTDWLLNQVGQGDRSATERLLERHRGRLRKMVAARIDGRLVARIDPSDVVQETLVEAHVRLPEYLVNRAVAFYPWLRSLAWNRLVDLHRRHILAERRAVDLEAGFAPGISNASAMVLAERLVSSGTTPPQRVLRDELILRMREALDRLSPADRETLLLRFVEQLSVAEASQVCGVPEGTLKTRQARALVRLKQLLDDPGESER